MKELKSLINNPLLTLFLGFLITALICGALIYLLVLPGYSSWQETNAANEQLKSKVSKVSQNTTLVKNFDEAEKDNYAKIMNIFYPEADDYLHFATLNETLAQAKGVEVTSFTTGQGKTSSAGASSPSIGPAAGSGAAAPVAGNTPATGSTGKATTSPVPSKSSGLFVTVAYKGEFEQVEDLLASLVRLDRLVGVSALVLSKSEENSEITANVTFNLPLSAKTTTQSTSENIQLLSSKDKDQLSTIEQRILYTAVPSSNPIGKSNPFN
jgi:hypothetical protein